MQVFYGVEGSADSVEVAAAALDAVAGPKGNVAWLDHTGLHLWAEGRSRFIARASAHGLAANAAGVLFVTAAAHGGGAGLAFVTWSGEVTELVAAPEDLPGPAGFHHPALSPDGTLALAFSDLTPRPSLWRVRLSTRELSQLGGEIPSRAEQPRWALGKLSWKDAEGQLVAIDPHTGAVEIEGREVSR
jgi:hypothetical protein